MACDPLPLMNNHDKLHNEDAYCICNYELSILSWTVLCWPRDACSQFVQQLSFRNIGMLYCMVMLVSIFDFKSASQNTGSLFQCEGGV